jgi:hypothetical protein
MEVKEANAKFCELQNNWKLSQNEIEKLKSELEKQVNEKQHVRNALLKNYKELAKETAK